MAQRLQIGDTVVVRSGNHRGLTGALVGFTATKERAFVEGAPTRRRHRKALPGEAQGTIVELPISVHVSNIAHVTSDGKPSRIRVVERNGERVRTLVKGGQDVQKRELANLASAKESGVAAAQDAAEAGAE